MQKNHHHGRPPKRAIRRLGFVALLAVATSCQTNTQFLSKNEPAAMRAAESRGRFELNCEKATGQVLSEKVTTPPMGPWGGGGIERAEYTIGIRGCGKHVVYVTICRDSSNCNALADSGLIDRD
jgi:hypothetical protein